MPWAGANSRSPTGMTERKATTKAAEYRNGGHSLPQQLPQHHRASLTLLPAHVIMRHQANMVRSNRAAHNPAFLQTLHKLRSIPTIPQSEDHDIGLHGAH